MAAPDRRLSTPDAGGHLLPAAAAQPELTAEYRLRIFFTSVQADQVTPVITEQEAQELASRLQHSAWVVERRMVGPWLPTSTPQRNRVVRDEVDPAHLHPNAASDDGAEGQAGGD
jgi:hypothetical protein